TLERSAGRAEVIGSAHGIPTLTVSTVREQADRKHTPRTVGTVHADRAHRIIDATLLPEEDADHDQSSGDGADDERPNRSDERTRRGDGHESCQHAVAH